MSDDEKALGEFAALVPRKEGELNEQYQARIRFLYRGPIGPSREPSRSTGWADYWDRLSCWIGPGCGIGCSSCRGIDQEESGVVYRERNAVECLINRLRQWRCIAARYEKWAPNYRAMFTIARILLWL